MFIGSIDKLNHEMTSYKTRHSSYGNPTGCMAGTRVKILADLEAWASDDLSSKVYWLVGMAGTGKSTISQTLCEILDGKNMLGASFFCSRGSENARNARLIVPTIAHSLASTSPCIKSEIVKAIENDPKLAEPTYINLVDQFNKLIHDPVQVSVGNAVKTYKIIVIDAVDECTDVRLVSSLIRLILESASVIPLKVFIASRDEPLIRHAFTALPRLQTAFYLHEADKDVVKGDIQVYLETSLAEIKSHHDHTSDTWPPQSEISALLDRSGTLFIYAATAIRYISQGALLYESRLSTLTNKDIKSASKLQTSIIDGLYEHILDQACESKEESEVLPMRQLVSMVIFLRNPLPIQPISSLSEIDNAHLYLSPFTSVIHVPTHKEAAVTPFHASFPDFITDATRCSRERNQQFCTLVASEGHEMLALKCLEQMNRSLKYNICEVPKESTVSRRGITNSPDNSGKISEALKYSCLNWAEHFFEAQRSRVDLIDALDTFLHKHLLHWIECLSVLGELQTGILSLGSAATALSVSDSP
jgi:nucleoside-triphosphatase THEP1